MWKWLLPALCVLATLAMSSTIVDVFGFGAKPWYGFWDSVQYPTGQPFITKVSQVVDSGATARAGIRNGDEVDVRRLSAYSRASLLWQPATTRPVTLVVSRNGKAFPVRFIASTLYDSNAALKITTNALWVLAYLWTLGCAWIIALRRWQMREGRYLCLALLAIVAQCVAPVNTVWGNGAVAAGQYFISGMAICAQALLPIALASTFNMRPVVRRSIEVAAVIAAAFVLFGYACGAIGALNASIDPLPFVLGVSWQLATAALFASAVVAGAVATAGTGRSERARTAWLLLPVPIALFVSTVAIQLQPATSTWESFQAVEAFANGVTLLGAAAVTYALLKRRVLDFQFVVSRALVVAGVSGIVVTSFVLLEWLLGTVLANMSQATGVAANALLALILGLSMSYIHKRVDAFVDFAFFRKRHADEHALRDFAKEAAFVTGGEELLDQAIDRVRMHTDAAAVAVLIEGGGVYRTARWYGEAPVGASENDGVVLALKAKHRPVDPHRYPTSLKGDVALPMLARGRLLGVLLCGARKSGEAYAPDEIDALAEFAQGVGSALASINGAESSQMRDEAMLSVLYEIRAAIESLKKANVVAVEGTPSIRSDAPELQ